MTKLPDRIREIAERIQQMPIDWHDITRINQTERILREELRILLKAFSSVTKMLELDYPRTAAKLAKLLEGFTK